MICPDCGLSVTGGDDRCPRCSARIKSWSLMSDTASPLRAGSVDDPVREDAIDKPPAGIRPLHGILIFLLVGIPSMISLVWFLLHNTY